MYTAGTISGTKGSNKITGKSTQWLSNLYNILEGQVIIIYTPTSSNAYSIKNIKSNTEIELSKPLYDAFTNATYEIFTTLDNTTSDAAVKIAQSINRNNEFMGLMNQWTTGTGTVTVNWGNEQIKLTTVDQMNKNIDGKLNASLAEKVAGNDVEWKGAHKFPRWLDVVRGDYRFSMAQMDDSGYGLSQFVTRNTKTGDTYTVTLPKKSGTLMQVGDFGWGGNKENNLVTTEDNITAMLKDMATPTQIWRNTAATSYAAGYAANAYFKCGDTWMNISASQNNGVINVAAGTRGVVRLSTVYSTANTTVDSNGNIKKASPIVKIYADDIVVNEESEGVELKKLHTGIYQLKGTLGMNSDPSWGGIHGGIVVPNGINGLQLVYADYDVLAVGQPHPFNGEIVPADENGDIVVYTTYRKHSDLPQNIQRARLKTYPEFTKEVDGKIVELSAGDFVDIPNGHWLDVRVQMPSNSVYNIRQAEQEELARIAAEKAEAKEVERLEREAIEEAERIEREEIERLEREEADRVAEEAERESYESNDGYLSV